MQDPGKGMEAGHRNCPDSSVMIHRTGPKAIPLDPLPNSLS